MSRDVQTDCWQTPSHVIFPSSVSRKFLPQNFDLYVGSKVLGGKSKLREDFLPV